MNPLTTVIIGCGKRAINTYLPILDKIGNFVQLKAVCNHSPVDSSILGSFSQIPFYTSISDMVNDIRPDFAIITTNRENHVDPFMECLNADINMLIETPLAETLDETDTMVAASQDKKVIIEVAENYYRYPRELIIQKLIKNGIFGKVNVAFSHSVGHGYHGIALLRSYFGFEAVVKRVIGYSQTSGVATHILRQGHTPCDSENWQHAIIEFTNGQTGFYSFSSLTYGSPLRQDRLKNVISFYAQKGMGMGSDIMVLDGVDTRRTIPVERKSFLRNGIEILDSYVAHDITDIIWKNPLAAYDLEERQLDVAICIYEIVNALRENRPPEYGLVNARTDRVVELAMQKSWENGNIPVTIDN